MKGYERLGNAQIAQDESASALKRKADKEKENKFVHDEEESFPVMVSKTCLLGLAFFFHVKIYILNKFFFI